MQKTRFLIVLVLTGIVMLTLSQSNTDGDILRDAFQDPSCINSCYLQIEPGVTTRSELVAILDNSGISYTVNPIRGNNLSNSVYNWFDPNVLSPNMTVDGVTVFVNDDIVNQVGLGLNVPISTLQDAFGNPDVVLDEDPGFTLIYVDASLTVTINEEVNASEVRLIFIHDATTPQSTASPQVASNRTRSRTAPRCGRRGR